MFCAQCGTAIEPGAKFCEECGAQASGKVSSGISLPRRIPFLVALSLAAILGIGSLLFFVGGPSSITERENLVMKEARKTAAGESPRIDLSKSPETARRELGQLGIQYSEEAFIKSVTNHDTLAVGLFLSAGMSPNTIDKRAWGKTALKTALMIAVEKGHTVIVKALLDKGAEVNAETRRGETALMIAVEKGHIEIVQLLKQAGTRE